MRFNTHYKLGDRHAFLSPSNYHWINYDQQRLKARFYSHEGARRGTELHKLAHDAIRLGVRLSRTGNPTIADYVNDAVRLKMTSEQPLYYSENCFGTPDAISFRRRKLRIHDLKTGYSRASVHQLEVYAALFCLEYDYEPDEIDIELRIYQNGEVQTWEGDPEYISQIMAKIVEFDMFIQELREQDEF